MITTRDLLMGVRALLMCLAVVSCSPLSRDVAVHVRSKNAELIARDLQRCPLWTQVSEHDSTQRHRITEVYLRVAQYDSTTIRAGISLYLNRYPPVSNEQFDASEKIFALLRVVFKVPRVFYVGREPLPFSLHGNPVQADGVDLLWPYSTSNDGRLLLTGVDEGISSGPAYDPLSDFDQMAVRLERRFPVSR